MSSVYFQPPDINPKYCEPGWLSENDPTYVYYIDEPAKILLSEVKLIPKEKVTWDKKQRLYIVNNNLD